MADETTSHHYTALKSTRTHALRTIMAMAAFFIHAFNKPQIARHLATKPHRSPDTKRGPQINATHTTRGFLRAQKSYAPPEDLNNKFQEISSRILGTETTISNMAKKFALLSACEEEFKHSVPNSLLHSLQTVQDILEFYKTPVNNQVPLDLMKNMDLPENVHIQYEYQRFHPETDAMFDGISAFPRSSTLVTGLKYKEKYRGFEARTKWPYNT